MSCSRKEKEKKRTLLLYKEYLLYLPKRPAYFFLLKWFNNKKKINISKGKLQNNLFRPCRMKSTVMDTWRKRKNGTGRVYLIRPGKSNRKRYFKYYFFFENSSLIYALSFRTIFVPLRSCFNTLNRFLNITGRGPSF